MPDLQTATSAATAALPPILPTVEEKAAIDAEKKEILAKEQQVNNEEQKFLLQRKREELLGREKRLHDLLAGEEDKKRIDAEKRAEESERRKKEDHEKEKVVEEKKRAEDEERAFVSELCSILPDDERSQLSWSVFKIEPGKSEQWVGNVPLSTDVHIYEAIRNILPEEDEGGEFKLKLMKGNVFATRPTLSALVKTKEAKDQISTMPLTFKVSLYGKGEKSYPGGRLRPDYGGTRPYGGYARPAPGYDGSRRGLNIPDPSVDREREKERDRAEREDRKDMLGKLEKERDERINALRDGFQQQMTLLQTVLKDGKGSEAQIQPMIKSLEAMYTGQIAAIREGFSNQVTMLKDEVKLLREDAKKAPVEAPKRDDNTAIFTLMNESSKVQATAHKEAAMAQATAMTKATEAQASAMKDALQNQSLIQKEIIGMQMTAMQGAIKDMTQGMKDMLTSMNADRERDRAAQIAERERDRTTQSSERERDRKMNETIIDVWKTAAADKKGNDGSGMLETVTKLANVVTMSAAKNVEAQFALMGRANKMLKKFQDDDEDEDEDKEKPSEFEKIMDFAKAPLMKVLEIALEQQKQGKSPAEIMPEAEKLYHEQMRQQEHARRERPEPTVEVKTKTEEPSGGKDMLEQLLEEYRDDVVPVISNAIASNADEDWLVGMVMSPDFPATARTALALLPVKKVLEKIVKFALPEEKAVLCDEKGVPSPAAVAYLEKIQRRMIELQKQMKKQEQEEAAKQSAGA